MNLGPHARLLRLLRCLPLIALLLLGTLAQAQADPPGRVGRLNLAQGTVTFAPAGDNEWTDAPVNRPLTRGDRVWTDRGSRAEIQVGSSAIRLDGLTRLEILELDDRSAKLSMVQGSAYVRVRSLPEGDNFEIDTPNLAYRVAYPGDYRIDVDPWLGTTRVTIHSGTGAVYGESGQVQTLDGGQQVTFRGRALIQLAAQESPPLDAFDRWAAERNRHEDQSISARYVPREVVGYQELDPHGQWVRDTKHGAIWFPQATPKDWAPYRYGHWEWIRPWGWTWMDDAAWAFATSHYGRWLLVDGRWAWVPGRLSLRPVYAPALVAFVEGGGLLPGSSSEEVAWFPLAPGEMWQPGFHASAAYISSVNRNMVPGQSDSVYVYQRSPKALTSISREDLQRGRPAAAGWLKTAAIALTNASVVPPPPMPQRDVAAPRDRSKLAHTAASAARSAAAPASQAVASNAGARGGSGTDSGQRVAPAAPQVAASQPVRADQQRASAAAAPAVPQAGKSAEKSAPAATASAAVAALPPAATRHVAPPAPPVHAGRDNARPASELAQAQQAEQQARAERARRAEAAAAIEARAQAATRQAALARAEAQRREQQQAQRAEARKREQVAARAEELRRDQAQRAERAKREQIAARVEQARREQIAQREQQAKREQQARKVELARRESQARRDEQRRREALARHDSQLRREAQARREEQVRREVVARLEEQRRREAVARREQQVRREAQARRDEQLRREARASQVEQARRAADREAQALRQQRVQRDELARRAAEEREQAQRESRLREQQAAAEQWRREHQVSEQQQRERPRPRPELRPDLRGDPRNRPAEPWQRGIPILNYGGAG